MQAIFWLGAMILLLVIEIATLGLTSVWFAGGAFAACIAAVCHATFLTQVLLFLAVSVILLLFTRPTAMRLLHKNRTKTNAEGLIGKEAIVTKEIQNLQSKGQVMVNGLEWTARTAQEGERIPEDTVVVIERIDGVKLIVKRKEG